MGFFDRLKQRGETLNREQQAAVVLLLVLGIGGLLLGFLSFGANIRRPFDLQLASYTGEKFLTSTQKEEAAKEAMKTTDVDKDGLTDYDETYLYKTSAYLADSDSDGIDDRTEIFGGKNPNCPEGKACAGVVADAAGATGADPTILGGPIAGSGGLLSGGAAPATPIQSEGDLVSYFNTLTSEQIRLSLVQSGVPKETVDALDDAKLRELFNLAIGEASASGQFDALLTQIGGTLTPEEIAAMTPEPEPETTPSPSAP